MNEIVIGTWNAEKATGSSKVGARIQTAIASTSSDIFILTEGAESLLSTPGFVVSSEGDWGYPQKDASQRKVIMWSRWPWGDVDVLGHEMLPAGRFVSARTNTPQGLIRVIGVCIPWFGAHVNTGRTDRRPWEDHENYLHGLRQVISEPLEPTLVAGDFNQKIPRKTQPRRVADLLSNVLVDYRVPTSALDDRPLIDHIAHSDHISGRFLTEINDHDSSGRLSDHRGVLVGTSIR